MQKEALELIQKIGKFLQEHDTVRLQKLLKNVKKNTPEFLPEIIKYQEQTFSQKLADITEALYVPGMLFGPLGRKAELDEKKQKLLEERLLLCLELKNWITKTDISETEREFFKIVYDILY
ncbi:hypothetical protein EPT53_04205 [Fusobacterium necrophorum]|uniref:Uncharacterized protein n=1 Tax=Fusobacterium necrophorum TaxID=859 RepID=A0A4V1QXP8_9FUSO|nr:hypothetical protein [Fusobacterium necrophorum]RXZ70406.1 hypothetical protein EPT53_04205 [Fusobacterium necrophorum]